MTDNRAPRGDRRPPVGGATAAARVGAGSGESAERRLVAVPPVEAGSRRDKGGSLWLAEQRRLRAQAEASGEAGRAAGEGSGSGSGSAGSKHCWVVGDPRWPGEWPALLIEWVRGGGRDAGDAGGGGWAGRVVFVPGPGVELVVAVVPATHLRAVP